MNQWPKQSRSKRTADKPVDGFGTNAPNRDQTIYKGYELLADILNVSDHASSVTNEDNNSSSSESK